MTPDELIKAVSDKTEPTLNKFVLRPIFDFHSTEGWGPWQQNIYVLREAWTYEWKVPCPGHLCTDTHPPDTYAIDLPAGLKTNFASSPFWSWWMGFQPDGDWREATALHDHAYEKEGDIVWYKNGVRQTERWSRENIDKLFFRHMRELGVPKWKRRIAYKAVRAYQRVVRGRDW